jgi:hypothetical protein
MIQRGGALPNFRGRARGEVRTWQRSNRHFASVQAQRAPFVPNFRARNRGRHGSENTPQTPGPFVL